MYGRVDTDNDTLRSKAIFLMKTTNGAYLVRIHSNRRNLNRIVLLFRGTLSLRTSSIGLRESQVRLDDVELMWS